MREEPDKSLQREAERMTEEKALPARAAVLEVLSRAATDRKFLVRLAANPMQVLWEYDLNPEERLALARGDIETLESWVGTLDHRLRTWPNVRWAQDKW